MLLDVLALHRVVDVGQAGVVKLQVTAAEVVQPADFLGVGGGEVVPELGQVGVDVRGDRRPAAPVVHHGRRGDRELRRSGPPQTLSRTNVNASAKIVFGQRDRRGHVGRRRRVLVVLVLVVERHLDGVVLHLLDAAELVDEVHVPRLAAQLAVGRGLQADLALHADDLADRFVLDLRELLGADLALGELVASLEHLLGAQQAADVVGTEGRTGVVGHAACSSGWLRFTGAFLS